MREAIMEDQDEFLMRNTGHTEVGLEANNGLVGGRSAECRLVYCQSRRQYANLGV